MVCQRRESFDCWVFAAEQLKKNDSKLEIEHVRRGTICNEVITKEDVIGYGNKERVESYKESKNDDDHESSTGKIITPNLKMFTLSELKKATRDFRPDTVLGEGGFGRVFKGWIDENTYSPSKVGIGIPVAVKKSKSDSSQGLKEWQVIMIMILLLIYIFILNKLINYYCFGRL